MHHHQDVHLSQWWSILIIFLTRSGIAQQIHLWKWVGWSSWIGGTGVGKPAVNMGDTILLAGTLDQIKTRRKTFISLLLDCGDNVAIWLTLLPPQLLCLPLLWWIVPSNFLMLFARHLVTTRKVPDMLITLESPLLCLRSLFFPNSPPLAMVDLFSVPKVLLSCSSLYPLISVSSWRFYDDNWGSHQSDYRGSPV